MPSSPRWQNGFLVSVLLAVSVLAFFIFRPYLGALLVAATFAVIFHPVYIAILVWAGGNRRNLAATLTTLLVLLIVILPLAWFGVRLWQEARDVYQQVNTPTTSLPNPVTSFITSLEVDQYTEQALRWLLEHTGQLFASVARLGIGIFVSLFALFYLLRDGLAIQRKLIALSPLRDSYDRLIAKRLHSAINSVIKGSLLIAAVQGILAGIGFAIFDVPNPVLWGSVGILAALIPSLGTALVIVPAVVYLFLLNNLWASIGLAIWGIAVVGLVDNLLRPSLLSRGIHIHPLLILLSVLGGLSFFGPLGFILGPLVVSLLFALLDIYAGITASPAGGKDTKR